MKKLLFTLLVTIIFIVNAFSQSANDSLQNSPTCFMIAHAAVKANTKNVSGIFCMGDKVKVKLKDNQIIWGTLLKLSRDSVITIDGAEIGLPAIQWITKTKTGTGAVIAGSLITAAGVITLATFQVDISSNEIPGQFIIGVGLIATGIVVLTGNTKFNVKNGDHLVFKD